MREMLNEMRRQAINTVNNRACTRLGTVAGYDPASYSVRVSIEPDGNLTRWIPLLSPWVGNGWGLFCPPSLGDLVEVEFQEADYDAPISCMRLFTDANRPLNVPSGEFWLVHKNGAFVKLTNDGKLLVNSQVEIDATAPTITLTATTNVNINAATAVVTASSTASVTAPSISLGASGQSLKTLITDAFISLFNGHTHNDPQGGVSAAPNQLMVAGTHSTTTVKGG